MISRRLFFVAALAAAGTPVPLTAQPRSGKIGYLHPITIDPNHVTFRLLSREWRALDYVEGETILARSAEGDPTRLPGLVRELIGQGVEVLIAVGADAVRTAAALTKTLPIVAVDLETDPVHTGLIASYARPGGNVTGLFMDTPVLATKWIEMMREMVPGLERIAFAWQPSTGRSQLDASLAAAKTLGIEAIVIEIEPTDDFAASFSSLAGGPRTGLIQLTFPGISRVATHYSAAAAKFRLPTMTFLKAAVRGGILMSYGPLQEEYFPRAVRIAHRILQGDKASDVPIERPTKFELVINLKTAAAIGIEVPPALLTRADEVIE